jgi:hypothetical protein
LDIRRKSISHLDVLAKGLTLIVTAAFEEARALLLMYGKAGPKWDPISYSRGSVSSRVQDFLHNGFSVLIDAGDDVLKWANEHDPNFASSLIGQWIVSGAPILQRLAITGMTGHPSLTSDEKLSWVISNRVVEDVGLKNETFALLAEVYGASSEKVRGEFLAQAEAAMNREGGDYERYEFFNLLSWLHVHAPECTLVTEKLHPIQERHPQWKAREHPDFNSWISGGAVQAESDSPIPASEIAEMNLEALLAESAPACDRASTEAGKRFEAVANIVAGVSRECSGSSSSFAASAMLSELSLGCSAKGRITASLCSATPQAASPAISHCCPLLHSNRGQTSSQTSSAI